jgi:predicted metalloendopeptidase
MPDRDDYLDQSPKMAGLRDQYRSHIAAMLKLAGIDDVEIRAARILTLEIQIAQTHVRERKGRSSMSAHKSVLENVLDAAHIVLEMRILRQQSAWLSVSRHLRP